METNVTSKSKCLGEDQSLKQKATKQTREISMDTALTLQGQHWMIRLHQPLALSTGVVICWLTELSPKIHMLQ